MHDYKFFTFCFCWQLSCVSNIAALPPQPPSFLTIIEQVAVDSSHSLHSCYNSLMGSSVDGCVWCRSDPYALVSHASTSTDDALGSSISAADTSASGLVFFGMSLLSLASLHLSRDDMICYHVIRVVNE